jgi:hypothetical protein
MLVFEPQTPDDDNYQDPNRTWWQRNALYVMAVFSLVMLVFVIAFTTNR